MSSCLCLCVRLHACLGPRKNRENGEIYKWMERERVSECISERKRKRARDRENEERGVNLTLITLLVFSFVGKSELQSARFLIIVFLCDRGNCK